MTSVMEIILALEERFNLSVSDEVWERVATVVDVFETLAEVMGNPAGMKEHSPPL